LGSSDGALDPPLESRLGYIPRNLGRERIHILELLFGPEIAQKSHFDLFAIDVSVQVE
jgi:hypothetical protein